MSILAVSPRALNIAFSTVSKSSWTWTQFISPTSKVVYPASNRQIMAASFEKGATKALKIVLGISGTGQIGDGRGDAVLLEYGIGKS